MWPSRVAQLTSIENALRNHAATRRPLPGIATSQALRTLAMQFVASLRREEYHRHLARRPAVAERADPNSPIFDAERAVAYHVQHGNVEEACWLIFLMTHFGKPADSGWLRLKGVYGRLGLGCWDWQTVAANPDRFFEWYRRNWARVGGRFGNHRKYESLRPTANRNFEKVVRAYLAWIGSSGHRAFFASSVRRMGNDPHVIFDGLYRSMRVTSFGRLAKFDYLMMLARYGIIPAAPGSAYLDQATGPAEGTRLLFDGQRSSTTANAQLQGALDELGTSLGVGMEVLEDAICNWQKSSQAFVHFKG